MADNRQTLDVVRDLIDNVNKMVALNAEAVIALQHVHNVVAEEMEDVATKIPGVGNRRRLLAAAAALRSSIPASMLDRSKQAISRFSPAAPTNTEPEVPGVR